MKIINILKWQKPAGDLKLKTRIPPLSIIVAVDTMGGFGKDGKIPWHLPEDLKHFSEVTTGGICIMGKKTYEDMYDMIKPKEKSEQIKKYEEIQAMGSPVEEVEVVEEAILPGRQSFVVTSNPDLDLYGATAADSIRAVMENLEENDQREIFILGGYRMFVEALPYTRTVYLTIVKDKKFGCDRHFPIEILTKDFKIIEGIETDELYFITYKRN